MGKNVFPYFRLWEDVPDEERYGGAWMARHIAEMRAQHPGERVWQDEARCAQWVREADTEVERRLRRPGRCDAAVLRNSEQNVWGPCSYRQTGDNMLCRMHRRMASSPLTPRRV